MRYSIIVTTLSLLSLGNLSHTLVEAAEEWNVPAIELPTVTQHPALACDCFDDLQSEVPHRYDWVYHNRASGVACDVADKPIARLDPEFSGQEYLQQLQQGQTNQPIRVRFQTARGTHCYWLLKPRSRPRRIRRSRSETVSARRLSSGFRWPW